MDHYVDLLKHSHIYLHTLGCSILSLKDYCKKLTEIKYVKLSGKLPDLFWVSKKMYITPCLLTHPTFPGIYFPWE